MEKINVEEFSEIFHDVVNNSFFPFEKKELNETLKKLKISIPELVFFFIDLINNQTISVNNQIEVNLTELPESELLRKLVRLLEKDVDKYTSVILTLKKYLDAILPILGQKINNINETEHQKNIIALDYNKELIRKRFNYDEKRDGDSKIKTKDFRGQHSFSLKSGLFNSIKARKIIFQLRDLKLIDQNTSFEKFMHIFSGKQIPKENRINWISTYMDLSIFLRKIQPKLLVEEDVFETALRCFTIKGNNISSARNLAHSSGSKKNEKIIESIINTF